MGNPIPTKSRELVHSRDLGNCLLCGVGWMPHLHHRRSRRVRDEHTHCACVLVTLCAKCHSHVHANPTWATGFGFAVSIHYPTPVDIPVKTYRGWVLLRCDGSMDFSPEEMVV